MTAPTHEEIAKITRELIDKGLVIEAGLDWFFHGRVSERGSASARFRGWRHD
jgi:hypothetical protein